MGRMTLLALCCVVLVATSSCGGPGGGVDATPDGPGDASDGRADESSDASVDGDASPPGPPPTYPSIAQFCGDGGVACAPPTVCIVRRFFSDDLSVCYDESRGRCGSLNCRCPPTTRCYTFLGGAGANEGFCFTEDEATRLCSFPNADSTMPGCRDGGVPLRYDRCPS